MQPNPYQPPQTSEPNPQQPRPKRGLMFYSSFIGCLIIAAPMLACLALALLLGLWMSLASG